MSKHWTKSIIQLYAVYKGLLLNSKTQNIEGKRIKKIYYVNSNKKAGLFIPIVNTTDFKTQIISRDNAQNKFTKTQIINRDNPQSIYSTYKTYAPNNRA